MLSYRAGTRGSRSSRPIGRWRCRRRFCRFCRCRCRFCRWWCCSQLLIVAHWARESCRQLRCCLLPKRPERLNLSLAAWCFGLLWGGGGQMGEGREESESDWHEASGHAASAPCRSPSAPRRRASGAGCRSMQENIRPAV